MQSDRPCGGCDGKGSHWRWCRHHVGLTAHLAGTRAEQAESLADSIGANNAGAANHLYAAASMLRADALAAKERYLAAQ